MLHCLHDKLRTVYYQFTIHEEKNWIIEKDRAKCTPIKWNELKQIYVDKCSSTQRNKLVKELNGPKFCEFNLSWRTLCGCASLWFTTGIPLSISFMRDLTDYCDCTLLKSRRIITRYFTWNLDKTLPYRLFYLIFARFLFPTFAASINI